MEQKYLFIKELHPKPSLIITLYYNITINNNSSKFTLNKFKSQTNRNEQKTTLVLASINFNGRGVKPTSRQFSKKSDF